MKKINIRKLLLKQFKDKQFARYDIVIRYAFIEEFYHRGEPDDFSFEPYDRLIKERNRKYSSKKFIKIIKSFSKNGYKEQYPIVLDSRYIMRNGAHRVACCLLFDIENIPFRINENKKGKRIFNLRWMEKHNFSEYTPLLIYMKNSLFKKIGVEGKIND